MQTCPPLQRAVRFSELSPPRQMLVRLCQEINYGALRGVRILNRDPVFEPPPVLQVDVKLDRDASLRAEINLRDFLLKDEVVRLMDHLDLLVTTTIECLEVHAGTPRRVLFTFTLTGPSGFVGSKAARL
jgi:hypothetical protein